MYLHWPIRWQKNTHAREEEGGNDDDSWRLHQKWQEKGHWNPTIVELTQDIMKLFSEMDENLVYKCTQNHPEDCKMKTMAKLSRQDQWKKLQSKYKFKSPTTLNGIQEDGGGGEGESDGKSSE